MNINPMTTNVLTEGEYDEEELRIFRVKFLSDVS